MAVNINLKLNAKGIVGKITAIETALESLDERGGDIDLGNAIDADGITGDIGKVISEINSLETDIDRLSNKLNGLDDVNLDSEHEVVRTIKDETGSTNDGASSGNDPPGNPGQAALSGGGGDSDDGGGGGGSSRSGLRNRYGADAAIGSQKFYGDWLHKAKATADQKIGPTRPDQWDMYQSQPRRMANFGHRDPTFKQSHWSRLIGNRGMFGMDPMSMGGPSTDWTGKRDVIPESIDDIAGSSGFSSRSFLGEGLSPFHQNIARTMAQAKYNAWAGKSVDDPDLFNGVDPDMLSGSEMQDVLSRQSASDPGENQLGDYTQAEKLQFFKALAAEKRADKPNDVPMDPNFGPGDWVGGDNDKSIMGMRSRKDILDRIRSGQSKVGKAMKRAIPSMSKYMQLLAALLPIAVALGTQLLGVASALGAVGIAGAAIMGLGLIGHGDSMSESFAQAKRQLRDLKKEMFLEVQPLAQNFASIQGRMFDAIPGSMGDIFDEMEGLEQFEGTLFSLGGSLVGGIERFFSIINSNAGAIDQLSRRFGNLLGSGLLNFFEFLIQAAYKNQQLLVSLGQDMVKLVVAAYNLSMAVAKLVTTMTPFINSLVVISKMLNNKIIIGLVSMLVYIYALGKTITILAAIKGAFVAVGTAITAAQVIMGGFTLTTWQAVAAATALLGVLSILSLGAWAIGGAALKGVAGDMGGGGAPTDGHDPGSMGGGMTYNDNRQYSFNGDSTDYATEKSVEDRNERLAAESLPPIN